MILVIGGANQGKLAYILEKTGLSPEDVARDPGTAEHKPIFDDLERWMRLHPDTGLEGLLAANPDVIIVCDEVGCGVVPIGGADRAWREAVGRLCCQLAERAEAVYRISCGLAIRLK